MSLSGHIQNGVVVFDEPTSLPEGTAVRVELAQPKPTKEQHRLQVPLVHTGEPGTTLLTGALIAEFLDDEDISKLC